MADSRPEDFGAAPGQDATAAVRQAVEAAGPTGRVILDQIFDVSEQIDLPHEGLRIEGTGGLRAAGFASTPKLALLRATASGVRIAGITLDQRDIMNSGISVLFLAPDGRVEAVTSRGTQRAFVELGDGAARTTVREVDHHGHGYGVLAVDAAGLEDLLIEDGVFQHPGSGTGGDGVEINQPNTGAREVTVRRSRAEGYIGEAANQGIGFGFAKVEDVLVEDCRALRCEGDGFHFENGADGGSVVNCDAIECGILDPVGGNGSGFAIYDTSRFAATYCRAFGCLYDGFILLNGFHNTLHACTVSVAGRNGVRLGDQAQFALGRLLVRDPGLEEAGVWYGIVAEGASDGASRHCLIELTGRTRLKAPIGGPGVAATVYDAAASSAIQL